MSITVSRTGLTILVHSTTTDLTTINAIDITYTGSDGMGYEIVVPSSEFLTQTATDITFTLPNTCSFFVTLIVLTLAGLTFSGTVALGTLSVLLANASGIYILVQGKTNDTLYIANGALPDTHNVAIPTPKFKTGFIGV